MSRKPDGDRLFGTLVALLVTAYIAHRGYYNRRYAPPPEQTMVERRESRVEKAASLLALPAFLSTAVYVVRPASMAWSALPLPRWLRWLGLGTAGAGFALLQWSQVSLARNWSDTPRILAEQEVVTTGPYRWVRHPLYAGVLLILASPLLLTASWFAGGCWLAMALVGIVLRIRDEEAMMMARFGDAYRAYMAQTGRLLPKRGAGIRVR